MANSKEASIPAVPIELLHVIFSYLPRASRRSFASLSRSIHWVLQPRLFEHTTITLLDDNATDQDLVWMLQKLEFLTNERISPAILFLRVTGPASRFGMYSAQLLASFLNILPGLLNLRVLHLSKINLFQYQLTKKLAVISGRVQEIVVNACEFRSVSSENNTSGCEGIALPLKYIRVSDDGGAWVNPPGTYWWWSARHVPMPLHTLVLANVSAAKHMLGMPLPVMRSLKDLSVPGDAVGWSTLWTSIAESCAGLEALRFINISKGKQYFNAMASTFYLPTDALAFLKLYEGPAEMTMPLIYERPVKHLVLYAVTDDKIALLAKALSIVQYADRMLSLHLDLDSVNDRVLEFISTFRNLQALSISVDSNIVCGYQPVDVVSTLLAQSPHTLSPHLEFFSLCALTRPTCEKPSPLQGFSDIRCPPYLRHCSRLRYVGFSEGETGASVHFSPWFGIWIEKQKTIEMWQNEVLGLYETVKYDPVPRS